MFYIDQTSSAFKQARQKHYTSLRYIILKKLLGNKFTEPHPAGIKQNIDQMKGLSSEVVNFLKDEDNLKAVLIGKPDVLDGIKRKFTRKKSISSMRNIINYDVFTQKSRNSSFRFYNAYHLAANLDQQTCIYCNRLYTHTIISDSNELVARATFDHWFPKQSFPLLALSFYNLIPSCSVCNSSVKGMKAYSITDNFHPYLKHRQKDLQLNFKFTFDMENHLTAKSKIIPYNDFSKWSIHSMRLEEMYNVHMEELRELIYLKKAYSSTYLDSLRAVLKTSISESDVYRLAFGVYFEDEHLHKRPLSKLKKDILTELGIAK